MSCSDQKDPQATLYCKICTKPLESIDFEQGRCLRCYAALMTMFAGDCSGCDSCH